jgi:hypothetical protein
MGVGSFNVRFVFQENTDWIRGNDGYQELARLHRSTCW